MAERPNVATQCAGLLLSKHSPHTHLRDGVVVLLPLEHNVARNLPGRGVNLRLQHICNGEWVEGVGRVFSHVPQVLGGRGSG